MLEELKEEQIVNKVGGRFKLSTLIQKAPGAAQPRSTPLLTPNQEPDGNRADGNRPQQNLSTRRTSRHHATAPPNLPKDAGPTRRSLMAE